jgi:hypothetical protein
MSCHLKAKSSPKGELFLTERVGGIEPPSSAWKADIIATIRHPLNLAMCTVTKLYFKSMSGRRESNSDYLVPNQARYHYTTPRLCLINVTYEYYR